MAIDRLFSGTPSRVTGPIPRGLLVSLSGGLLFVLIFRGPVRALRTGCTRVRDDGVITMSHARLFTLEILVSHCGHVLARLSIPSGIAIEPSL